MAIDVRESQNAKSVRRSSRGCKQTRAYKKRTQETNQHMSSERVQSSARSLMRCLPDPSAANYIGWTLNDNNRPQQWKAITHGTVHIVDRSTFELTAIVRVVPLADLSPEKLRNLVSVIQRCH